MAVRRAHTEVNFVLLVVLTKPAARIANLRKTYLCTTSLAKIKTQKEELSGCASYENTDPSFTASRSSVLCSAHFDVTSFTTNLEIAAWDEEKRAYY